LGDGRKIRQSRIFLCGKRLERASEMTMSVPVIERHCPE
jgi:hypothetical protein